MPPTTVNWSLSANITRPFHWQNQHGALPLGMRSVFHGILGLSALYHTAVAALPGTRPLTGEGDRSAQMVAGISRFLDRQIASAAQKRPQQKLDSTAVRKRLRHAISAVDPLLRIDGLQFISNTTRDQQSRAYRTYKGFAAELADRGFIVFAPHNP